MHVFHLRYLHVMSVSRIASYIIIVYVMKILLRSITPAKAKYIGQGKNACPRTYNNEEIIMLCNGSILKPNFDN